MQINTIVFDIGNVLAKFQWKEFLASKQGLSTKGVKRPLKITEQQMQGAVTTPKTEESIQGRNEASST